MRYVGAKADLEALAPLLNKADSRPQRGVPHGGGTHIVIPETYSDGAQGWLQLVRVTNGVLEYSEEQLLRIGFSDALSGSEKSTASALIAKLSIAPDAEVVR